MSSSVDRPGKPAPAWSAPVWVKDTTYRFVNVGNAPAFDVFVDAGSPNTLSDLPLAAVMRSEHDLVAPGGCVDIVAVVEDHSFPARPDDVNPQEAGWPPIAPSLRLAWNVKRGWTPHSDDPDPLWFAEEFGVERQHYSTLSLPLNRLPIPLDRRRSSDSQVSRVGAVEFVQFERVLNIYLKSSHDLTEVLDEWEQINDATRRLVSKDLGVVGSAWHQMRNDIDPLVVTVFTSRSMLSDHAKRILKACDASDKLAFEGMRSRLVAESPFARYAETIRDYVVHHGMLDLDPTYTSADQRLTLRVDPAPILRWAQTRDRKRTDAQNVQFAEFVKAFTSHTGTGAPTLRDWVEQLLQSTKGPMLALHRSGLKLLER